MKYLLLLSGLHHLYLDKDITSAIVSYFLHLFFSSGSCCQQMDMFVLSFLKKQLSIAMETNSPGSYKELYA
jgi:hypothetical protein